MCFDFSQFENAKCLVINCLSTINYVGFASISHTKVTDLETHLSVIDDEPTAASENLVKSGGVYKDLSEKVDKENGKGLVDTQFVEVVEHDEFIKATCDAEGRVLQGIKADGKPYFPYNEMMEVDDILGYYHLVLDNDNKILEGINDDGEKHISKFDKSTQDLIKGFAGSDYISIPMLDANFTSSVSVEITGTKGADDAKYVFDLLLSDKAFNIRFKFRITENLLNENKSAVIAKLGNSNAVIATPVSLSQLVTTAIYNEEQKNCYWGTLAGGISLNNSSVNRVSASFGKQNIGLFAFYVRYVGSEDEAYI